MCKSLYLKYSAPPKKYICVRPSWVQPFCIPVGIWLKAGTLEPLLSHSDLQGIRVTRERQTWQAASEEGKVGVIFIVKIGKLRVRELRQLGQDHTGN